MLVKEYRICMPITVEEVFIDDDATIDSKISIPFLVQDWAALHDSKT